MSQPVDAIGNLEQPQSRDRLVQGILARRRTGIQWAMHQTSRENKINVASTTLDRSSANIVSPSGTRIHRRGDTGGALVELLTPVDGRVTTYDDGGLKKRDRVIGFAEQIGVNATDYIRVKPQTVTTSEAPEPTQWHDRNMAAPVNTEIFVIDADGRTRRILESPIGTRPSGTAWHERDGRYYLDTGEMNAEDLAFYDQAYGAIQDALNPRRLGARRFLKRSARRA